MRYAWNQYFAYFAPASLSFFSRLVIPPVVQRLRVWDESSSARVDHFIANSRAVARRIQKYYRRAADIIPPPVDTDFFRPLEQEPKKKYFLIVSALVPYKRIDLAVQVFNRTGETLKIVGTGPGQGQLQRSAGPNIEFLGQVPADDLRSLYSAATALLLPGEEDFGIAVLEAQACGTPVIAYGRGGAAETVVSGQTGLLFADLSAAGLRTALDNFRGMKFNTTTLRSNAMTFSRAGFKRRMASYLEQKWAEFKASR
jgi:glycosyltransferase involved in cell wall biosynthesis